MRSVLPWAGGCVGAFQAGRDAPVSLPRAAPISPPRLHKARRRPQKPGAAALTVNVGGALQARGHAGREARRDRARVLQGGAAARAEGVELRGEQRHSGDGGERETARAQGGGGGGAKVGLGWSWGGWVLGKGRGQEGFGLGRGGWVAGNGASMHPASLRRQRAAPSPTGPQPVS